MSGVKKGEIERRIRLRAAIAADLRGGATARDISSKYGVSKSCVSRWNIQEKMGGREHLGVAANRARLEIEDIWLQLMRNAVFVGVLVRVIARAAEILDSRDAERRKRRLAAKIRARDKARIQREAEGRACRWNLTPEEKARRKKEQRRRYSQYPINRVRRALRCRLQQLLKGVDTPSKWKLVGCTSDQLRAHLESKFLPGMTWENYGAWHVDHILPLALFDLSDPVQLATACNWQNLQPLWAKDNVLKGARVLESIPVPLPINVVGEAFDLAVESEKQREGQKDAIVTAYVQDRVGIRQLVKRFGLPKTTVWRTLIKAGVYVHGGRN